MASKIPSFTRVLIFFVKLGISKSVVRTLICFKETWEDSRNSQALRPKAISRNSSTIKTSSTPEETCKEKDPIKTFIIKIPASKVVEVKISRKVALEAILEKIKVRVTLLNSTLMVSDLLSERDDNTFIYRGDAENCGKLPRPEWI